MAPWTGNDFSVREKCEIHQTILTLWVAACAWRYHFDSQLFGLFTVGVTTIRRIGKDLFGSQLPLDGSFNVRDQSIGIIFMGAFHLDIGDQGEFFFFHVGAVGFRNLYLV